MAASTRYVVVGGGIAGVSCIEELTRIAPQSDIMLISSSELIKAVTNYQKVSKTLESFDVEERHSYCLMEDHPSITILHDTLTHIDDSRHMINLSSGECIYYHKLCLCTGAKPMMIIKDHSDVIAIRDTESVESLRNKLSTARRVIVVGNGGIATELVYEMKTCDIVWVVKDSSICTKFVDEGAAKFLLDHLYQQYSTSSTDTSVVHTVQPSKPLLPVSDDDGTPQSSYSGAALGPDWSFGMFGKNPCANVHIEYLSEIVKVDANGNELYATHQEHWPLFVTLSNGKVIGCDFVISATGVQPNIGYINDSFKISQLDGGILVDDEMRTSVVDVYAAGDVCSVNWPDTPMTWFQMRLWSQARQMGVYAARCMTSHIQKEIISKDFCFELFSHITKFFGFKVVLLGLYNNQGLDNNNYELLLRVTQGHEYIKIVLHNGRIIGALLIGNTDLEETMENLILNKLDVSHHGELLLDPSIDIEDYFD